MAKRNRGKRGKKGEAKGLEGTPQGKGGVGRKEDVRGSGVWPESLRSSAPPDSAIRTPAEWGQAGDPEGYEESGRSELSYTLEEAEEYQRERESRAQGKGEERKG